MASFVLKRIAPDHLDALNAMILRSKAYWGYGEAMMAKMETVLRLDPEAARNGRAIAAWSESVPLGIAQMCEPLSGQHPRRMDLDLLFIAPEAIGTGLGAALYHWALDQARASDAEIMGILSDPNARGFYTAMGAIFIEDRPSELIENRALPWLEHRLR